jgi:hypothetical protein
MLWMKVCCAKKKAMMITTVKNPDCFPILLSENHRKSSSYD